MKLSWSCGYIAGASGRDLAMKKHLKSSPVDGANILGLKPAAAMTFVSVITCDASLVSTLTWGGLIEETLVEHP